MQKTPRAFTVGVGASVCVAKLTDHTLSPKVQTDRGGIKVSYEGYCDVQQLEFPCQNFFEQ